MGAPPSLQRVGPATFELGLGFRPGMRVPVRIFGSEKLVAEMDDQVFVQAANVATLPGIVEASLAMPDAHWGYGFPIGGVAAMDEATGVISPGGIGFDINCGVRLLASRLRREQIPALEPLVHELSRSIPTGFGRHGRIALDDRAMDRVLEEGCAFAIREMGLGLEEDLDRIESRGSLEAARAASVSDRAKRRGSDQLGTLGGGNHFLEVQIVDAIVDEPAARAFGLFEGQITVLLHTGSRGLGHQVCTDYVAAMDASLARHGITLPDRQLACAPFSSREGQRYFE
ncbi:MAG TPA: RtcB family protein, partial [Myxococcota bacterium]|nr:RtcB family protein [Myxococcota bacterium]